MFDRPTTRSVNNSAILIGQFVLAVFLLFFNTSANAQIRSINDGRTPTGVAEGAVAGSYTISGFENINLYNGMLNIAFPLLSVGGRGSAGYTMTIKGDYHWKVYEYPATIAEDDEASLEQGRSRLVGYGPGKLLGLSAANRIYPPESPCGPPPLTNHYPIQYLTRLTFIMPDGSEVLLHDKLYGGAANDVNMCTPPQTGRNRGRVFVSADGESMTFISDFDITDLLLTAQLSSEFYTFGNLMMKDGTCYRIDWGRVSWIRDRNGNKVSFTYEPNTLTGRVLTVTDSLNRVVSISYAAPDPAEYAIGYDEIRFKGFGGAQRSIKIWYDRMQNIMYPGQTIKKANQLFPLEIYNPGDFFTGNWDMNGIMLSKIELPDQRAYQFLYNSYGEIARIILPTGGGFDYEHSPSACVFGGACQQNLYGLMIYRRVTKRTTYNTLTATTDPNNPPAGTREKIENYVVETPGSGNITVRAEVRDGANVLTAQSKHYFYGNPIFSGDEAITPVCYSWWAAGREFKTESFDVSGGTAGAVLRTFDQIWSPAVGTGSEAICYGAPDPSPKIAETINTHNDTNQVAKQAFSYDQYNNQTDIYVYDFGIGAPGPLSRRTQTSYLTTNPHQSNINYATDLNIHIRNLPWAVSVWDGNGAMVSNTWLEYDRYNLYALQDCSGIVQHDGGFHTGYAFRGNLTKTIRWLFPSTEIANYSQHDIAGNVVKVIDGRTPAGITTLDYIDRFGAPGNDARSNAGAPELAGGLSYAFPTKVTNALLHTAYTQYDYYLGRAVTTEDANEVVSSIAYNDALDRPTQSIQARYVVGVGVPAVRRQTTFTYDDANRVSTTTSDLNTFNDSALTGKSYYDGLGRRRRGAEYEGSTWTLTDTQFDAFGRISQVSNPYSAADPGSASPPANLWTTTEYDEFGRVIKVTTPDTAAVNTEYSGNLTLAIDQAGNKQISQTDALGRLTNIWEVRSADPASGTVSVSFPNHPEITAGYQTDYLYDAVDNLRKVTQGTQKRWFAYDSLSRLIRVKNPEQADNSNLSYTDPVTNDGNGWSMAYSYDANGNLVSKTDARNITTSYAYDALNRNTSVDYSNTTVTDIRRFYDNTNPGTYGIGRFREDYAGGGNWSTDPNVDHTAIDSYDPLGRPLTKRQLFKRNGSVGPTYSVNQTYDLAGNVKRVTYPSGRNVDYSHDQTGRLSGFSGALGGSPRTYADTIGYNAAGQMIKERFGTNMPLYRNLHYNNRLQLVDTRLGDSATDEWNWSRGAIAFLYGTTAVNTWDMFASDTDNNGNLRRQLNYVPLAGGGYVISQLDDYTYDALNRLGTVREQQRNVSGQWSESASQAYSYDRWGNRTLDLSGGGGGQEVVWLDDSLPAGAASGGGGGDDWNWVSSSPEPKSGSVSHISNLADWSNWSPAPYSGNVSHQSSISSGLHQHYYHSSPTPIPVRYGGTLYAYIYMDPANPPQEVMLQWGAYNDGWEHRAYWGANILGWGTDGTASRRYMGPLPAAGGWVRLEVPASAVGLEGMTVGAMAFTLYGGRANWDLAGISGVNAWEEWVCSWNGWDYDCYWQQHQDYENFVLVDDSIPAGAVAEATDGDSWNWRGASNVDLVHQHFFYNASDTLQVSAGDKLFTWVYLDPANPPQQVMLQWHENANWDHRAYWGANLIGWGTDGTASRRYMGPLPAAGGWVKLEIPASAVGLEGKIVNGMAFTLYGGRAAWDKAGKVSVPPPVGPPINSKAYVVDATTNRLQPPSGSGTMQYDAAGNLEIDPYTSGTFQQFVYDGENRMVEVKNGAGVTVSRYVYDAEGRRAGRIIGAQETWQVYGIGGELLAEYGAGGSPSAPQKEYGYRNGQMLVVWDGGETGDRQLQWLVQDHLGSTRMVVDRSGSLGGVRRHDFAPFGEELFAGAAIRSASNGYSGDFVRQKFTSKERDVETNLDYFVARYYGSTSGRFLSPDPVISSNTLGNPSGWNRYTYVWNRPLVAIDPDGREGIVVSSQPGNHKNRTHFLENGLDRATKLKQGYAKKKSKEKVTWFIYNGGGKSGYKDSDLAPYLTKAKKAGINVEVVSDQQKIVDYVNDKNGGNSRQQDLISNFVYIGHASPGDLLIGYGDSFDELDFEEFEKEAFSKCSAANLVGGCNTSIGARWESSVMEQMSKIVGGRVKGSNVRVHYPGGIVSDEDLVRPNLGSIIEMNGWGTGCIGPVKKKR